MRGSGARQGGQRPYAWGFGAHAVQRVSLKRAGRLVALAQQNTAIERAGARQCHAPSAPGSCACLVSLSLYADPGAGSLGSIVRQTVTSPTSAAYPAALALAGYFAGYGEQGAVLGAPSSAGPQRQCAAAGINCMTRRTQHPPDRHQSDKACLLPQALQRGWRSGHCRQSRLSRPSPSPTGASRPLSLPAHSIHHAAAAPAPHAPPPAARAWSQPSWVPSQAWPRPCNVGGCLLTAALRRRGCVLQAPLCAAASWPRTQIWGGHLAAAGAPW